jgi:hypothetical protein
MAAISISSISASFSICSGTGAAVSACTGSSASRTSSGEISCGHAVVDPHVLKSVPRHVGKYRILGILDDGDAAAFFDRREPCGPVVERSRENHIRPG